MTNVTFDPDAASPQSRHSGSEWFFSDPDNVAKLRSEAESWLNTPFFQYSKAKGPTGGVDCVGLCEEIMRVCGVVPAFNFPRFSADYQGHAFGDKFQQWIRGEIDDPQSKLLAERFAELELPDFHDTNPPRDFFMPGDLLLLKRMELFHVPIMIDDDRHFINAVPRLGVIRGTIQDSSYRQHLIAAFRARSFAEGDAGQASRL